MAKGVEITALAYGSGAGVGRIDGKVVFVPYAAPGDVVAVEVTKEEKSYSEARIERIESPSPLRREPRCKVFGRCGGCQWQHMEYAGQLKWKREIFCETLRRIGGVEIDELLGPVEPSPLDFNYRCRATFQVSGDMWGFFERSSHNVVDIDECPLVSPEINETFLELKGALGLERVRSVGVCLDEKDSKTVAVISLEHGSSVGKPELARLERLTGGRLKGVEVVRRHARSKGPGKPVASLGDTLVSYRLGTLELRSSATTFSQVNLAQNQRLVEKVTALCAPNGTLDVLDLYCGVGNLTLPLAQTAASALGVDSNDVAISLARTNALINDVSNAKFIAGKAERQVLDEGLKTLENSGHSVLILDPTRKGAAEAIKGILDVMSPDEMIYVSCNPATLARDLALLYQGGYRPDGVAVIDMFPQTYHIEGVVSLTRRG